MQQIIFFFLTLLFSWSCAYAQPLTASKNIWETQLFTDDEIKISYSDPQYIPNGSGLFFSWRLINADEKSRVNHLVSLYTNDSLIYQTITTEPYLKYKMDTMPALTPGMKYRLVVTSQIQNENYSYLIGGSDASLIFLYEPVCQRPRNISILEAGNNVLKITWDAPPAQKEHVEYLIEVFDITNHDKIKEIVVSEGRSTLIEGLESGKTFEIQIKKLCYAHGGIILESESESIIASTNGIESLTNCGGAYNDSGCPGTPAPSNKALNFKTLRIRGFNISVDTLTFTDAGYIGYGLMTLPFQGKKVKVKIQASVITMDQVICDGAVEGLSDAPAYWPNFYPPTSPLNQICLKSGVAVGFNDDGLWMPDSLPWNPQGFGPDSLYIKQPPYPGYTAGAPFDTTNLYDPWGFNAACINITTGTEFDPNGCSCHETDIYGNPCQHTVAPYYWLNASNPNGPPTLAGINFVLQNQNFIVNNINQALILEKSKIQILLDSLSAPCDSLRQIVVSLADEQNTGQYFVFGQDNIYLNEGLSEQYIAPIENAAFQSGRSVQTVRLENEHVNLYTCDGSLKKQKNLKAIIEYFQSSAGKDSLVQVLLDMAERFTAEEVEQYSNPSALITWIKAKVKEQIIAKYEALFGPYTGFLEEKTLDERIGSSLKNQKIIRKTQHLNHPAFSESSLLAMGDGDDYFDEVLLQSFSPRDKDLLWSFNQGMENIYGIDRGYVLEYLAETRRKNELFPEFYTVHDTALQPIEIRKWVGGRYYYVYLDKIKVEQHPSIGGNYSGYAQTDIYLIMDVPTLDQKIVLKANNIMLTPNGPEVAPVKLYLNNDIGIRLSNAALMTLSASPGTFAKVDCNGFDGISIEGEIEFCREYVVPVDPATQTILPDPQRVKGSFVIQATHWNDIYSTITFTPFAITKYEDYKWILSQVTLDFSDEVSPGGLPPSGYTSPFANQNGFLPGWTGVYIGQLELFLPKQFNKNNQTTSVGVQRVLIDERGFSGTAFINTPMISLNEGSASGWAFSVNNLGLTFTANQLTNGFFGGKINVPIFKGGQCNPDSPVTEQDCFDYNAKILPDNQYQLTVSMASGQNYCADLWKAGTVVLKPNSVIKMELKNGEFEAQAILHGAMFIQAQVGSFELNLPDTMAFENLVIRSKAPYFSAGNWSMPSSINCNIGGFGVSLKNIGMSNGLQSNEAILGFDLGIGLTKESGNNSGESGGLGITATARFKITGILSVPDGRQRWKFKEASLSQISIDATIPGAKLKGELAFYEDPAPNGWGKGFRGIIDAKFGPAKLMQYEIKALAHFGRKSGTQDFKYFFVDALVVLPSGVTLFPPLELKGLGGGIYYHMTRNNPGGGLPTAVTNTPGLPSNLGMSLSGIQYVPDYMTKLGLKLTVVVSIPKETAFNANLSFEMEFGSNFSIRKCAFDGIALVMANLNMGMSPEFTQSNPATFKAKAHIDVQFTPNFQLFGKLEVFLNVANKIVGVGPGGKMVDAEVLFAPGKWYINIGTPTEPCGVKFQIGGASLAQVSVYMDIGKQIPKMPELPPAVKAMTGLGNFMTNESMRATGNGFAFGAKISIGSGEKKCIPNCNSNLYFYAYLNAMAGFDLMLQDYGDATCSNLNGADLGINGWYASGQAYALLQTGLGVGFKLFGQNKELQILDVGAAAALQMKLPNPFWAKGAIGGRFNVMGGLIKGDINFQFTIGESCQITGGENPSDDLIIISDITPINGSSAVDVSVQPSVTFNLPIGESIQSSDLFGVVTFKTELEYVKIIHNGIEIPKEMAWMDNNTYLKIIPKVMLPANDSVRIEVKVNVYKNDLLQVPEIKFATFFTGATYDKVPAFNVKAAYPFDKQYNFYPGEWNAQQGYVLLYAGQPTLFQPLNGSQVVVRVSDITGMIMENPVSYTAAENRVSFPLPAAVFTPATLYKLELVRKVQQAAYTTSGSADKSAILPSIIKSNETVLLTSYFRTSQFNTFSQKLAAINNQSGNSIEEGDQGAFKMRFNAIEPFDFTEINGAGTTELISMTARLSETPWYVNHIKPVVYDEFGNVFPSTFDIWVNERPTTPYWRIPYNAVFLETINGVYTPDISEEMFNSGVSPSFTQSQYINYLVPQITWIDWSDICDDVYKAVHNNILNNNNPTLTCCLNEGCCAYNNSGSCTVNCNGFLTYDDFLNWYIDDLLVSSNLQNLYRRTGYTHPVGGNYPVDIRYNLPGLGATTSVVTLNLVRN